MFKSKNMKKLSLVVVTFLGLFAGCVSDQENNQIIYENNLRDIDKYLEENDLNSVKEFKDPGTGIVIVWQELSDSGILPENGDTLQVDYIGSLLNKSVFDTSIDSVARANNIFNPNREYTPLEIRFGYGQVIPGFEFGLSKMEMGDKATVIMPSLYAYGSDEFPGIPKNSVLVFELDLLDIIGQ